MPTFIMDAYTILKQHLPPEAPEDLPTCCQINFYAGHDGGLPAHADDEPLFGRQGDSVFILSFSMGGDRQFGFFPVDTPSHNTQICLAHGDLLIMTGHAQTYYRHYVSKDQTGQRRINITWRWIRHHNDECPVTQLGQLRAAYDREGLEVTLDEEGTQPVVGARYRYHHTSHQNHEFCSDMRCDIIMWDMLANLKPRHMT